jgi:type I restriction enzyme S subunit
MSEHVIRIVPDTAKIDPCYLEAYLRSPVGYELLTAGVFGSVIDEITLDHVAEVPVPIPPRAEMERVSAAMRKAAKARDDAIRGVENALAALQKILPV